ncbi:MAG: 30S ribosomal protein S17 [Lentisphaeria bacterium]|nr:30S ribosomal protein S17 [Lentisphaeria bacterium]
MAEETHTPQRPMRKTRVAKVVSDCQDKTLVCKVERRAAHPLYRKVVKHTKKCYVHDEHNQARVGDVVQIMETRPLSKLKRWRLVAIVQRAATD